MFETIIAWVLTFPARMRAWAQRWIGKSVFLPLPKGSSMESMLAAYFHRASATIYFVYCIWSVVAIVLGIPSLIAANGEQWQTIFSISVLIFAAPSCFGATFWPSFARLEAFAGSAFVGLILLYIGFLTSNAIHGLGPWAGVILITSVLVLPGCRVIIVCVFLLRQARSRKEMYNRYLAELKDHGAK